MRKDAFIRGAKWGFLLMAIYVVGMVFGILPVLPGWG